MYATRRRSRRPHPESWRHWSTGGHSAASHSIIWNWPRSCLIGEAHGWRSTEAIDAALFLQRLASPDRSPWFVAKMAKAVLNFYAELEQHPGEPRHPRVRGAVRRLERLDEMALQNLAEQPGDPEAAAEDTLP